MSAPHLPISTGWNTDMAVWTTQTDEGRASGTVERQEGGGLGP